MSWHELQAQPLIFWVVAFAGVYFTGISKSGFAGGPGVLAMPMISLVIDAKLAAAILLPLLIFMDLLNVNVYRRYFNPQILKPLILGALTGIIAGALCFSLFNGTHLKLLVGVIALGYALLNLYPRPNPTGELYPGSLSAGIATGCISGFTSFIAHAGSPPVTGYLLRLKVDKLTFLATATVFFTILNLLKLPAYALIGQFNLQIGLFAALLAPSAWLGVITGLSLKDKLPEQAFRNLMNVVLLLLGLYLIGESLWLLATTP